MSRCKACNCETEYPISDPITKQDTGLCGLCFGVSELVRADTFQEYPEYVHGGASEGLRSKTNLSD